MANSRAWLVGTLAVLGLVVLVALGSGRREDYGRVRAAVGARALQEQIGERPTPAHHGR